MLTLIVKRNDQELRGQLPVMMSEVTFRQWTEFKKAKDNIDVLSIFTGLDKETLRNGRVLNEGGIVQVMNILSFLSKPLEYNLPKTCMGYAIPQDLEPESIGQYEDLKKIQESVKTGEDPSHLYPLIVATYARRFVNGKQMDYDFQTSEILAEKFWEAPCLEVMSIGNFTLLKWIAWNSNTKIDFQKRASLLRKSWLALKIWLNDMGSTLRFYFLKKKLRSLGLR